VHPTKAEVRFLEQSLVHEVLRRALTEALGEGRAPEIRLDPASGSTTAPTPPIERAALPSDGGTSSWQPLSGPAPDGAGGRAGGFAPSESLRDLVRDVRPTAVAPAPASLDRPLLPLGQFRDTFIIAIDDEGIAIIDQHVAHERILFEQVMERLTAGPLESQRLLSPMVLDLPPAERGALTRHEATLARLGFEVEEFGGDAVCVAAVPALIPLSASEVAIRALAQDLDGLDEGSAVDEALRQLAATTACHAAVKAHDRLTPEKMTYILDELRRTAHSSVCPHGRPVVLRLSRHEIERRFERV
jgi:DNA mismatch repair protein MutL